MNSNRVCVYPGSFDPFTLGHLDILNRARALYDNVIVAVAENVQKSYMFDVKKRIEMIESVCEEMDNVEIIYFHGLITDFMKKRDLIVLLRGIRDANDFLYESKMSRMNHLLYPGMETIFLHTHEKYGHVSSSLVKEIAKFNGDLSGILPPKIVEEFDKLKK